MTVQIPGFCGIYFNQPLPSSVKASIMFRDESVALREYDRMGHWSLHIDDGYVPRPFMAYDYYLVRFYPSSNDKQHWMDKEYLYRQNVGCIQGFYSGSIKNEYGKIECYQKNKEKVISLFHKTKAFLDDWLEIEGRVKTQNAERLTYTSIQYDVSNCNIGLGCQIYENKGYIRSVVNIEVSTKEFDDILQKRENGDVSAFM